MGAIRDRDVQRAREFLAEQKRLKGDIPLWYRPLSRKKEIQAIWSIEDALEIERAHIAFRCDAKKREDVSMSLIFGGNTLCRVDVVGAFVCHNNPPWAHTLGLPALVCGPHIHDWDLNVDHILLDRAWEIPARRPLPPQIRRFDQAFPWFLDLLMISFLPEQRAFTIPPQADLFEDL